MEVGVSMAIDLADYERTAHDAVKAFWRNRASALQRQVDAGRVDQGERASVTAGKNMDGFKSLIVDIIKKNGMSDAAIYENRSALALPGYFRSSKLWDLLIKHRGQLIAAIELKSQVGPSFGNNFNNRTEEAIGIAHDFWTAYREGALGDQPRPFIGWIMLVEDAPQSQARVKDCSPHFPVFKEFKDASYVQRYNVLCQKLVREGLYTSAALLVSPRTAVEGGGFSTLSATTSLRSFVTSLAGHIAAEAALLG